MNVFNDEAYWKRLEIRENMRSQALTVNGEFLLASFNESFPACSFSVNL